MAHFLFNTCPKTSVGLFWWGGWTDPAEETVHHTTHNAVKENYFERQRTTRRTRNRHQLQRGRTIRLNLDRSQPMYRKLLKLGYEPIEGSDRSAIFEVPKRLVSVRKPRKISEAHRTKPPVHCAAAR